MENNVTVQWTPASWLWKHRTQDTRLA